MGIGFAGGLASGLQAGFETAGRQRERGLQALKFTAEQRKELRDRLSTQLDTLVATVGSGIKDGKFTFDSLPQGISAATEMMFDSFGRALGPDEEARARTTFQARIQGFSTPTETARVEGAAEAVSDISQADALVAAGVEPAAAAEIAGVTPAFRPPQFMEFQLPDGEIVAVDVSQRGSRQTIAELRRRGAVDAPEDKTINFVTPTGVVGVNPRRDPRRFQEFSEKGFPRATLQIQPTSAEDLLLERSESEVEEIRSNLVTFQSQIATVQRAIQGFRDLPIAAGIAGTVVETGGGLLQQLDALLERARIDVIPEMDLPQEVRAVRTTARLAISQTLQTVTQETSGRFTDTERRIAQEINATLDDRASLEQVLAAGKQVISIMQASHERELAKFLGASNINIGTTAGRQELATALVAAGLSPDEALDGVLLMVERFGIDLGR